MPRIARFLREDEPTVYHVIFRTALDGLPFKDTDKEYLLELVKKWSRIFFVDLLGFAIMGNHFHLVVRMYESPAKSKFFRAGTGEPLII